MQFQISSRRETRQRDTWVIKIRVLKKVLSNVALSDAEDNTSRLLNRGDIADLPLLRTLGNSPKVLRAKFLGRDVLFCSSDICKFNSFKNPFPTINSINFPLDFPFILLVQMEKVISIN